MKKFEFIIPKFPPSVNKLYTVQRYNHKRRILTKEGRDYKDFVDRIITDEFDLAMKFVRGIKKTEIVKITYVFCSNWLNKNGTLKKKDVVNFEKILTDAIFKPLKIDDSIIWSITMTKAHSFEREPFVMVTMTKDKLEKYLD